jgi:predicted RNA binding protein YcfA (HicA-like mRNA interferase family)
MKIKAFLRHLQKQNCLSIREGGNHTIFQNQFNKKISSVPRHKEVKNNLVRKICKDPEISTPENFQ